MFSITTGWPSDCDSACANGRANVSPAPPGGERQDHFDRAVGVALGGLLRLCGRSDAAASAAASATRMICDLMVSSPYCLFGCRQCPRKNSGIIANVSGFSTMNPCSVFANIRASALGIFSAMACM